jgi:hypothetical protein
MENVRMCHFRLVGSAPSWGVLALVVASNNVGVAAPSLEEIVEGLRAREHILFENSGSFQLIYSRISNQKHLPSRVSDGGFPVEYMIMRKGPVWRFRRRFLEPGDVELENKTIRVPDGTETVIVKDGIWLDWDTHRDYVLLEHFRGNKAGFNFHPATAYFIFLGIDLVRQVAEDMSADYDKIRKDHDKYLDHPFLPRHIEANRESYHVHADQEDVDGFSCWVVEYPKMDKFWVDVEHGFSIRRRTYHWVLGKPLRFDIRNEDYEQVHPGLWLPMAQTVAIYANIHGEKKTLWGQHTCTEKYEVQKTAFNSLADSDVAQVDLPEGIEVADVPRGYVYRTQGDGDPFAGPIARGRQSLRATRYRAIAVVVSSMVLIVVAIGIAAVRRRKRSGAEAKSPPGK